MEKRDAFSFGTQTRCIIDESEAGFSAALKGAVEIVHRKADVVNAGASLGDIFANWRVLGLCLQKFHERFTGGEASDGGAICIVEWHLGQAKDVAVKRKQLVEGAYSDANVGDARAAADGIGHDRLGQCGRERTSNSNPADERESNRRTPGAAPAEHMMANAVEVKDDNFATEIEAYEGLAVVDFWATWCAPCRMIAPIVEQLATEYAGKAKVAKLDVDNNQRTAARFNVRSIPTILFFKDGKLIDQVVGAVPRPALEAKFKEHA